MGAHPRVKKAVIDSIKRYLDEGVHSHVVIEYTTKGKGLGSTKVSVVDNGAAYLVENGYSECGFKCYSKKARVNKSIAYIAFETERLGSILGVLDRDLDNIENDAKNRAAS